MVIYCLCICCVAVAFQSEFDKGFLIGSDNGLLNGAFRRRAALSERERHADIHAGHFFAAARFIRITHPDGRIGQLVGTTALRQKLLYAALFLHHAEFVVVFEYARLPECEIMLDGLRCGGR